MAVGGVSPHRREIAVVAAVILLLTVAAYWPSLSAPFQFDDYARITGNWNLHAGRWWRGIRQLGGSRVLPASTIALNFWWSGEDTLGYHLGNLLVHIAATAAMMWMAMLIARTPRVRGSAAAASPLLFAGAAAALFACHPLQTQAVTYIIQRSASMAACCYIAAVGAYLAGRLAQLRGEPARRYFAAGVTLAAAALLSKENAVTWPATVLLAEVGFFGRRQVGRLLRFGVLAAPVLALPIAFKLVSWRFRRGGAQVGDGFFDAIFAQGVHTSVAGALGPLDYFLTQMIVIPRYLGLAVVPLGLNVDHHVRAVDGIDGIDGGVAAGAALLVVLFGLGLWALRAVPVVGFGILWVFVTLSVESTFIPIHDVMMEHRMYLAMPGVALIFAAAMSRAAVVHLRASAVALAAAVLLLAALTFARNQVWQSALSLWSDAAAKSPEKARVHVNVGVAYHGADELDAAIRHYCRAIEIDPEIPIARENIEVALEQQGRLDDVMTELEPVAVQMPGAPEGTVVLEYDVSLAVCDRSG